MRARGYGRVKYLTFFSVRNLSMAPYRDTCPLLFHIIRIHRLVSTILKTTKKVYEVMFFDT